MAQSTGTSTTIFMVDHTDPGPLPMSKEFQDDNQYLVEAILSERRRHGVTQYLVSWLGDWSAEEKTSWVDEEDVCETLIQDFKASGIVLPSTSEFDDEDEMDLSGDDDPDGSGSQYSPDDDDDMHMDMSDDAADRSGSTKLPTNGSDKSSRAAPAPVQRCHNPSSLVTASQVEENMEMQDWELVGAAMEAQDLQALDAAWEAHDDTPTFSVDMFEQASVMMQPAAQQPSQAPTVSQTGFGPNLVPTTDDDAWMDQFIYYEAARGGRDSNSEEDADGSEISEGEQARYDATSSWRRN
jgi:hypothetical protein